jgi:hypothetical protein
VESGGWPAAAGGRSQPSRPFLALAELALAIAVSVVAVNGKTSCLSVLGAVVLKEHSRGHHQKYDCSRGLSFYSLVTKAIVV